MSHHVIIGSGPAATNAIETIRQLESSPSKITLVSDEVAHSRMALPYWLSGQISREQTFTGDDDYFQRLSVETRWGRRATKIDRSAKVVQLDDGDQVPYDQLLLATGSTPLRLPVPGGDLPGVTPKWNLQQFGQGLELLDRKPAAHVVLVGAGFIGLIVLSALFKRGCKLTVVERDSHVLPRMLSGKSAQFAERWLRGKGIQLLTKTEVSAITQRDDGTLSVATSSDPIVADLVVVAIGVQPNVTLAQDADLQTDHGILVNGHLQTSDPAIFAAGDCAQGPTLLSDDQEVHAIHPTAVDHGRIAGAKMAGRSLEFQGSLSMNVLDVCGLQCVSYGNWNDPNAEAFEICSEASNVYRSLLWTDDRLTGAMFVGQANNVGMLSDVGMVKGLIQTQMPLGDWKEFLRQNPFDIRRAFIGTGVAEQLRKSTLTGAPSAARGFHYGNTQPSVPQNKHHVHFMSSRPS